jgi:rhodanese-related sulfurtransferase
MRVFKMILCGLMLTGLPLRGQDTATTKYVFLDPYYFHLTYLKEDPALIADVRMPFEYRGKIIRDAINVPSGKVMSQIADTLDRDYSIFVYCTTDDRARGAAELFYDKGFRKIYILRGGIREWRKEGMPVERGRRKRK